MVSNASPSMSAYGRSPSIGPPAYTTDDLLAAKNQKFSRWIHFTRIVIAGITLATSIAIVACAGVALKAYSDSHLEPEWLLPLWPLDVDLRPSHSVLGCGITVLVLSLIYLATAFIPMPRKFHNLNILSTVLSFLSLFASLFTAIYACIITNNMAYSSSQGSLNSWTCKWQGFEAIAPADFTRICNGGTAALDLVILLAILEFFAVAVTAWGWWVEMRLKRCATGREKDQIELV